MGVDVKKKVSKDSSIIKYPLLFITTFLIDRLTKYAAVALLTTPKIISPLLSFELGFNRGLSWGVLQSQSSAVFGGVSLITVLMMLVLLSVTVRHYTLGLPVYAHTIIFAGAFSNLVDRVWYGGVVDFIKLSYAGWTWPLFNVADILIVGGAFLLLFCGIKRG